MDLRIVRATYSFECDEYECNKIAQSRLMIEPMSCGPKTEHLCWQHLKSYLDTLVAELRQCDRD